MVNTIVGSGSLLTFPALLAAGYSPVVANVSNSVGLVLGNLSGVVRYRGEPAGQERHASELAVAAARGPLLGAALLLARPASVFHPAWPALVPLAIVLAALHPRL